MEQQAFLEKCLELWEEFQKLLTRSETWLGKAEYLVSKETYGYSLEEADTYVKDIKVSMYVYMYVCTQNLQIPCCHIDSEIRKCASAR